MIYEEYKDIPIHCRICKYFLQDDNFIDDYYTKYVCNFDEEISNELLGFECKEFKIGKHQLVEFMESFISNKYLFICVAGCGDVRLVDMKPCKDPLDPTIVCPKCGNCTWYITPKKEEN